MDTNYTLILKRKEEGVLSKNRDLWINLCFSGLDTDLAYLYDPTYSIETYELTLLDEDFIAFARDLNERFLSNLDLRLMGRLYRIEGALSQMDPTEKNYPQLLKNYTDVLRATSIMLEKYNNAKDNGNGNALDGLILCLDTK